MLESGFLDALFAFAIITPLLFVVQLGFVGPALSFGCTLVYGGLRWREVLPGLGRRWPLLLVPAYALLSVLWSDYPGETLKHALELTLTVAGGLLLSASPASAGVLAGVWAGFAAFMIASFALGHSVTVGSMTGAGAEATAFAGLNGVKNLFGMTAALAVLTSLFMVSRALARRSWLVLLGALGLLLVELYLVYIARSAGALLALSLGSAAFLAMSSMGLFRLTGRIIACGLLVTCAVAVGMVAYGLADSLGATTLSVFHKDPTLTGRSYLWYRAADLIHERAVLGRGFEAFWVQGNIDAEGLWQYGKVPGQAGFNFHSTVIELLVHFGWAGTLLTLGVFALSLCKVIQRGIQHPNVTSAFYVAFVTFKVSRGPFESLMPSSVDFATVLMFAALGYGFHRLRPSAAPVEYYASPVLRHPQILAG